MTWPRSSFLVIYKLLAIIVHPDINFLIFRSRVLINFLFVRNFFISNSSADLCIDLPLFVLQSLKTFIFFKHINGIKIYRRDCGCYEPETSIWKCRKTLKRQYFECTVHLSTIWLIFFEPIPISFYFQLCNSELQKSSTRRNSRNLKMYSVQPQLSELEIMEGAIVRRLFKHWAIVNS